MIGEPGVKLQQGIRLATILLLIPFSVSAEGNSVQGESAKASYSIGYQVGSDFRKQGVAISPEILLQGVEDALKGEREQLSAEERREALMKLQDAVTKAREEANKAEAEKNLADGKVFLEENSRNEGVVTLPSGLQYTVLKPGTGPRPGPDDAVTVQYRGTLIDGTEFDSSVTRGGAAGFRPEHMIPGWKEALPLMKQGAKWRIVVPPELGYGNRRVSTIGPNSVLVFEIELLGFGPPEPAPGAATPAGKPGS